MFPDDYKIFPKTWIYPKHEVKIKHFLDQAQQKVEQFTTITKEGVKQTYNKLLNSKMMAKM